MKLINEDEENKVYPLKQVYEQVCRSGMIDSLPRAKIFEGTYLKVRERTLGMTELVL